MAMKKKLIEVALPLEAINQESAREKSIRKGHPSTLHLWWARRPLAAARAVIWSSLVDDPSSHPEQFPDEESQKKERDRLFSILAALVKWENSNDEDILAAARAEIMKSTDGNPPALLDPFSGGGAIPFEAQRLGLEAHAHDLNPVAVMINKAMIEIPPKFAGLHPVNPDIQHKIGSNIAIKGSKCLAEDVRYYGEWVKTEAYKRIGHLYPTIKLPSEHGGTEAPVIAWIWAKTAKCPNPACECTIPLTSGYLLCKKKNRYAWIVPKQVDKTIEFTVHTGEKMPVLPETKIGRGAAFVCPACGQTTLDEYIKGEGKAGRIGKQLMAIVAEGKRGRIYLSPTSVHARAAEVEKPEDYPNGLMPTNPRWFSPPAFGMDDYASLFNERQLTALTVFADLIKEVQTIAEKDAEAAGMFNDHISLAEGGSGARAYGEAIGVYLSFVEDRMADKYSNVCIWNNIGEKIEHTFGRQAIPMAWDYAEANPFSNSSGCFSNMLNFVVDCLSMFDVSTLPGTAKQFDAQSDCGLRDIMVSTDPPYYDNIGYADLSDYFYVWMRQALKDTYPKLFRTMLVPKSEELVATPYRFDGSMKKARDFFEEGMYRTCCQINTYTRDDIPVTIYYAFKQSENETGAHGEQTASTGWETMLSAIIRAGFSITGTWPMRTERAGRMVANGTNALASSIILVCRKRDGQARSVTRREFINALHREMRPPLKSSNLPILPLLTWHSPPLGLALAFLAATRVCLKLMVSP